MNEIQKKALGRTLRKVAQKHRVKMNNIFNGVRDDWTPGIGVIGREAYLTPEFSPTNREKRRLVGMLPELWSKLARTANACGYKGDFELSLSLIDLIRKEKNHV